MSGFGSANGGGYGALEARLTRSGAKETVSSLRLAIFDGVFRAKRCEEWCNRNIVERLWARLKGWRAIATRYEKTASSFMGVLCLASTLLWIK